jgi:uncharacterized protein (TIRG00374 family)
MTRRTRLLLFVVGAGMFAWLIGRVGVSRLVADARATGWMIVPIVLLFTVVYACSAQAWQLVMADESNRPPFRRTYAILVAGLGINYITPMVNAGGEPYKVAALAPWLGSRRAAGAVILHTMLRTLGSLLVWLTAAALGFLLLPHRPTVIGFLTLAAALAGGLVLLLLVGHRDGVVERLFNIVRRLPGLRRVAESLETHRPTLAALDRQITAFWHRHPRRFFAAVALEYLGRCVFMVEFCLIGASIGVHVGYAQAFVVGGLEGLISNVLFLVPFELGTREAATVLLFTLLGFGSGIGLYAAIVSRVRDVLWIGAGLLLIWVGARPRTQSEPTPSVGEVA